jgi:WD40 repeat protein
MWELIFMRYLLVFLCGIGWCGCEGGLGQGDPRNPRRGKGFLGNNNPNWSVTVNAAAWSPDGKRVVLGYEFGDKGLPLKKLVKVWDVRKGKELVAMEGHNEPVVFVAFSPDGNHVVSAAYDGKLNLYNAASGHLVRSVRAYTHSVRTAALSPDGKHAITLGSDKDAAKASLRFWNLSTRKMLQELPIREGYRNFVAVSPDNRLAFFGTKASRFDPLESRLRLWNLKTGKLVQRFQDKKGWGGPALFSPDGKQTLVPQYDYTDNKQPVSRAIFSKLATAETIWASDVNARPGGFIRGGKLAFGWEEPNTVCFWELATGKKLRAVKADPGKQTSKLVPPPPVVRAVCPDGRYALTAIGENENGVTDIRVRVWDLKTGKLTYQWQDPTNPRAD